MGAGRGLRDPVSDRLAHVLLTLTSDPRNALVGHLTGPVMEVTSHASIAV